MSLLGADIKWLNLTDKKIVPSRHWLFELIATENRKVFDRLRDYLGWEEGYLIAVIFINIFCIFDTIDNINAKSAENKGVYFLDVCFSRILMNFLCSWWLVRLSQSDVWSVPIRFRLNLGIRSLM